MSEEVYEEKTNVLRRTIWKKRFPEFETRLLDEYYKWALNTLA